MPDSAAYMSAVAALVGTNPMRVLSSPKLIAEADNALRMIIDTFAKENTTFSGVRQSISRGFPDPLRALSEACHEGLKMY
jgi:hypothetical protein